MDNLTFSLWLGLAMFCGVCLFLAGVWVGGRFGKFLAWAVGICLMLWGIALVSVALVTLVRLWTSTI